MRNRYRLRQRNPNIYTHVLPSLSQWAAESTDRLLLAHTKADARSARFFATDLVDVIQETGTPILWVLPGKGSQDRETDLTDILRRLTLQALQIARPQTVKSPKDKPISASDVEKATTEQEWFLLLRRSLLDLERIFIVIDTDILKDDGRFTQRKAVELMEKLVVLCGDKPRIKTILIARRFRVVQQQAERDELEDDEDDQDSTSQPSHKYIFTDAGARGNMKSKKLAALAARRRDGGPTVRPKQMALLLKPAITSPLKAPGPSSRADSDEDEEY